MGRLLCCGEAGEKEKESARAPSGSLCGGERDYPLNDLPPFLCGLSLVLGSSKRKQFSAGKILALWTNTTFFTLTEYRKGMAIG